MIGVYAIGNAGTLGLVGYAPPGGSTPPSGQGLTDDSNTIVLTDDSGTNVLLPG